MNEAIQRAKDHVDAMIEGRATYSPDPASPDFWHEVTNVAINILRMGGPYNTNEAAYVVDHIVHSAVQKAASEKETEMRRYMEEKIREAKVVARAEGRRDGFKEAYQEFGSMHGGTYRVECFFKDGEVRGFRCKDAEAPGRVLDFQK